MNITRTASGTPAGARSWIRASEACEMLRISRPTLYAYVSRGYIRSEAIAARSRERRYSRDDVERLARRREGRRDPDRAAARTLQWGMPVLESSITLIADNRLYYRGHDVVHLARSRSIAEVASLVWTGTFDAVPFGRESPPSAVAAPRAGPPFGARAQAALALESARDPHAYDLRPRGVARTGWRILNLLTCTAARKRTVERTVDRTIARGWGVDARGEDVIRAALVLCADHELNVSAFAARCVASSGSNPYAVVLAGLAAIEGTKHGGVSLRVESLLETLRSERNIGRALAERLRRGEVVDGFGHPLYRDGDPRAAALLELLCARYPRRTELDFAMSVSDAAAEVLGEKPTIDFALAAFARVLELPRGAPLTLFAIGRTIGWIGHALEQYATGEIIRPRARYAGAAPHASQPHVSDGGVSDRSS